MKPYKSIMIFAVFATALLADTTTEVPKQAEAKVSQSEELAKTGNEALRFILEKTKDYTGKAENALGQAVDLAQKEAPETIRQFLVWRAWKHGISALVGLAPFLFGIPVFIFAYRLYKKDSDFAPFPILTAILTTIIGAMAFFTQTLPDLLSLIQIHAAPRIYLIEQLHSLMR